jgi:hypothetical protein
MGTVLGTLMANIFDNLALISSVNGNENFTTVCPFDKFALFVLTTGSFTMALISLGDRMLCICGVYKYINIEYYYYYFIL